MSLLHCIPGFIWFLENLKCQRQQPPIWTLLNRPNTKGRPKLVSVLVRAVFESMHKTDKKLFMPDITNSFLGTRLKSSVGWLDLWFHLNTILASLFLFLYTVGLITILNSVKSKRLPRGVKTGMWLEALWFEELLLKRALGSRSFCSRDSVVLM